MLAALSIIFCAALAVRLWEAQRVSFWFDELWSLSIATGHAVGHTTADSDRSKGDFIEPAGVKPASYFAHYLQLETSPADMEKVFDTAKRSDWMPPLYFWCLNIWIRLVGDDDFKIRLLPVFISLGTFPFLWLMGRQIGGRKTAFIACWLYALSPTAVFYSFDNRCYSLLWLFAIATSYWALRVQEKGLRPMEVVPFTLCLILGLWTHLFFIFYAGGCLLSMLLKPRAISRPAVLIMFMIAGSLALPWYLQLPYMIKHPVIGTGAIDGLPPLMVLLSTPLRRLIFFLSGEGDTWLTFPLAYLPLLAIICFIYVTDLRRFPPLKTKKRYPASLSHYRLNSHWANHLRCCSANSRLAQEPLFAGCFTTRFAAGSSSHLRIQVEDRLHHRRCAQSGLDQ